MHEYSLWFFADGWKYVTGLGVYLGWTIGLRSYLIILPLVLTAILNKGSL